MRLRLCRLDRALADVPGRDRSGDAARRGDLLGRAVARLQRAHSSRSRPTAARRHSATVERGTSSCPSRQTARARRRSRSASRRTRTAQSQRRPCTRPIPAITGTSRGARSTPGRCGSCCGTPYFSEGWALYAERVMRERGFFTEPDPGALPPGGDDLPRGADRRRHEPAHGRDDLRRGRRLHDGQDRAHRADRRAEVGRYCSWPTQASSYLTGLPRDPAHPRCATWPRAACRLDAAQGHPGGRPARLPRRDLRQRPAAGGPRGGGCHGSCVRCRTDPRYVAASPCQAVRRWVAEAVRFRVLTHQIEPNTCEASGDGALPHRYCTARAPSPGRARFSGEFSRPADQKRDASSDGQDREHCQRQARDAAGRLVPGLHDSRDERQRRRRDDGGNSKYSGAFGDVAPQRLEQDRGKKQPARDRRRPLGESES